VALEALEGFAAKGDDSAAASRAELYGCAGEWQKVIGNTGRLIANPHAVYAGNVFDDMIRLLGPAGHRTGDWSRVREVARAALKANKERAYDQYHKWAQDRANKLFENLIAYAERSGQGPHELLSIFSIPDSNARMTKEQREGHYRSAVENVDSLRPDLKRNPARKTSHFFGLAKAFDLEDEALRLHQNQGADFLMAWDAVEYVSRIHVKRGDLDAAWAVLEANLGKWWPVDHAQVAPVVLLIDEHLCKVMTPDRCKLVLATPRGSEAAKEQ